MSWSISRPDCRSCLLRWRRGNWLRSRPERGEAHTAQGDQLDSALACSRRCTSAHSGESSRYSKRSRRSLEIASPNKHGISSPSRLTANKTAAATTRQPSLTSRAAAMLYSPYIIFITSFIFWSCKTYSWLVCGMPLVYKLFTLPHTVDRQGVVSALKEGAQSKNDDKVLEVLLDAISAITIKDREIQNIKYITYISVNTSLYPFSFFAVCYHRS